MFDSLKSILADALQDKQLQDTQLIGQNETQFMQTFKGTTEALSDTETIPSLFKKAVSKYSEKPALSAQKDALTFLELDKLSDNIAFALLQKGVKKGDRVAFMLPRNIYLIPTLLGILKSGAVFVPLDPMYPEDRVQYILENSDAAFLVSTEKTMMDKAHNYLEIEDLVVQSPPCALPDISQTDTAYMIYTSGTTGKPKGVMLSHRGIINIVKQNNNPFNKFIVKNCKGIVAIGSICFDISLFEIFVPLMNGLFVHVGSEKAMMDANALADTILQSGADFLHCTPSRLQEYLLKPKFKACIEQIKGVLSAGEVLPKSLIETLKNTYNVSIFNGYGPTETTIGATITEDGDNETIGRAIGNSSVYMLNKHLKRVPFGVRGEIVILGAGVGQGYFKREEETKTRFIYLDGQKAYKSGDVGHFLPDGRVVYHGRNDRQIKLNGLRIELMEIENVMATYPNILNSVCLVRTTNGYDHLVCFFTATEGVTIDVEQLKAHLKKSLTAYMVPSVLKQLSLLPMTPGGKTDIAALKNIPISYERKMVACKNEQETCICKALQEVTKAQAVSADQNFFEAGLDSLRAIEFMLQIEKSLDLESDTLSYEDIFRCPTAIMLAEKINGEIEDVKPYDIKSLDYQGMSNDKQENESFDIQSLGNVLITGVTGYLGVHMLIELLQNKDFAGKIFCLARGKRKMTAEKRVRSTLFYYAETTFSKAFDERLFVIEGDITDKAFFNALQEEQIDTVINVAANVSHFAHDESLQKINVQGVQNLIDFALQKGATLCQVSTISVCGVHKGEDALPYDENDFYVHQKIFNEYIYSKYLAEYYIKRCAVDKGLKYKVIRIGNLQGRIKDGEFQMNMNSNAFTRQLSSYVKMQAVPQSLYSQTVNFSPVDDTAQKAVYLLMSNNSQKVYHVYPEKEVAFEKMFKVLHEMGKEVQVLSDEAFEQLLQALKQQEDKKELVMGLLTEKPKKEYTFYQVQNDITTRHLKQLGQTWQEVTDDTLRGYLEALDSLDMF